MKPERLNEIMKKYRSNKARYAYLCSQLDMLHRFLERCESQMVNDQISMSQAITGMPHGSSIGDPTGRLATMKIIDEMSWAEILDKMNHMYSNSYSKRSLQRMADRAIEKAEVVVK